MFTVLVDRQTGDAENVLQAMLLTACNSVGVGFGIPAGPFSIGVGAGTGGVSAGVGVGPLGVGVSTPVGNSNARVGAGIGAGRVLYDPNGKPVQQVTPQPGVVMPDPLRSPAPRN